MKAKSAWKTDSTWHILSEFRCLPLSTSTYACCSFWTSCTAENPYCGHGFRLWECPFSPCCNFLSLVVLQVGSTPETSPSGWIGSSTYPSCIILSIPSWCWSLRMPLRSSAQCPQTPRSSLSACSQTSRTLPQKRCSSSTTWIWPSGTTFCLCSPSSWFSVWRAIWSCGLFIDQTVLDVKHFFNMFVIQVSFKEKFCKICDHFGKKIPALNSCQWAKPKRMFLNLFLSFSIIRTLKKKSCFWFVYTQKLAMSLRSSVCKGCE